MNIIQQYEKELFKGIDIYIKDEGYADCKFITPKAKKLARKMGISNQAAMNRKRVKKSIKIFQELGMVVRSEI